MDWRVSLASAVLWTAMTAGFVVLTRRLWLPAACALVAAIWGVETLARRQGLGASWTSVTRLAVALSVAAMPFLLSVLFTILAERANPQDACIGCGMLLLVSVPAGPLVGWAYYRSSR